MKTFKEQVLEQSFETQDIQLAAKANTCIAQLLIELTLTGTFAFEDSSDLALRGCYWRRQLSLSRRPS